VTLLAALLVEREREVTDAPADLLIDTVHCVGVPFTVLAATSVTWVWCGPAALVGEGP
jgi:hypothetical protein